ncbi:MAG: NAD-dependent epimerase/dehydratase family protein [Bacteroidetes bacterium]|nr:MAG: NAD-dependent epimerase/dehydratase family protein [Bacteroidota bacterium]
MQRILIIGANSFIGTNFRKSSVCSEINEVSLLENRPEDINFENVDVVLHLAALVHQSKKIKSEEYYSVNRDLPVKVAELAKHTGVKQFIFLSTVKVYGKYVRGSEPWNEDSECHPDDAYGKSKYDAELGLRKLETPDFLVSIIRTPIVYGPGVMANILKLVKLVDRVPILPFKSVNNNRHYTFVGNLVGFIDRIIENRASGTFIAMDEVPLSTSSLVLSLSTFLNRKVLLFRVPGFLLAAGIKLKPTIFDRLYGSFYLDNTKTKESLGFYPPFSSDEGLSVMISAYLKDRHNRDTN